MKPSIGLELLFICILKINYNFKSSSRLACLIILRERFCFFFWINILSYICSYILSCLNKFTNSIIKYKREWVLILTTCIIENIDMWALNIYFLIANKYIILREKSLLNKLLFFPIINFIDVQAKLIYLYFRFP